jgi:RNA polymerase sigma-70 factor (ECF subfamily)
LDRGEERKLVQRLKGGDSRAFDTVVGLFQHKIYGLVFRMLGNAQEAEDLAQEVFVTLFTSIDGFREESRLGTWLYRIAVNHCRNRIKYLARRNESRKHSLDQETQRVLSNEKVPGSPQIQAHLPRPDQMAEGRQLEKIVQKELAALESDQRALIVLRDIEGLTYSEIVEVVGQPLGTVKSRLHRGRMTLKEKIAKYFK